jgi:phosphonate transport system substrate-binding protein
VHRDVKPGNVIVDPAGPVTLTDFGIVRAVQETRLTATGTIVGTPEYMSPEQAKGLAVGAHSDQYSLAVVAYEMLSGQVPFEAESTLALLHKIAYDPPPPLCEARPDLPVEMEQVLVKALAKEPGDRYGTVGGFVDALERASSSAKVGEAVPAPKVVAPSAGGPTRLVGPQEIPAPKAAPPPGQPAVPAVAPAPPQASAARPAAVRRRVPVWAWAVVALVVVAGIVGLVIGGPGFTGPLSGDATDTRRPTKTAVAPVADEPVQVPEPTAKLPSIPTLGSEENPIIWSFVPSGEMERVTGGARAVAEMLHDKTGLHFQTNVAAEYAGVIEVMCSDPPQAHMGSLGTFAYVLAADRGCAEAELVSVRFGSSTYIGQIIARADSGIEGIGGLAGRTFCRPDPLSASGWIIPYLTMRAAGLDPASDLAEIVDAGSHDAVVAAVYYGDCAAGATYVDARGTIEQDHPDVMERVVVMEITVDVPNDGVQFVPAVPEELRARIVEGLLSIAGTEEGREVLDTAYGWTGLEKHDDRFYDPFRHLLEVSGMGIEELEGW